MNKIDENPREVLSKKNKTKMSNTWTLQRVEQPYGLTLPLDNNNPEENTTQMCPVHCRRHHADFHIKQFGIIMEEYSQRGTYVNGQRYHQQRVFLSEGDFVEFFCDNKGGSCEEETSFLYQVQKEAPTISWTLVQVGQKKQYPLQDKTTIGRTGSNTISLTSPYCSREHCRLDTYPEGVILTDHSSNGTTVNTFRIKGRKMFLQEGDTISIGHEGTAQDNELRTTASFKLLKLRH